MICKKNITGEKQQFSAFTNLLQLKLLSSYNTSLLSSPVLRKLVLSPAGTKSGVPSVALSTAATGDPPTAAAAEMAAKAATPLSCSPLESRSEECCIAERIVVVSVIEREMLKIIGDSWAEMGLEKKGKEEEEEEEEEEDREGEGVEESDGEIRCTSNRCGLSKGKLLLKEKRKPESK